MSRCRSCNADIIWTRTKGGKWLPLDKEPTDDGNVELQGTAPGKTKGSTVPFAVVTGDATLFTTDKPRYTPHWATCPQADNWRKT